MPPVAKAVENDGRINLGFRRLIVSHVENAGTFYAYTEEDASNMQAIDKLDEQCEHLPRLVNSPQLEHMYGVFHSGIWYRGKVEEINRKDERMVRVRMVDFGWNDFVPVSDLCQLPKNLIEAQIKCEKYKMAAMKPKGRYEGYSATDREKGKQWLEKIIDGRVVDAECHILVRYGGGIQIECKVDNINLNQAAVESGHVIMLKDRMKFINARPGKKATMQRSNLQSLRGSQNNQKCNQQNKGNDQTIGEIKNSLGFERRDDILDGRGDKLNNQMEIGSSFNEDIEKIFMLLDQVTLTRKRIIGKSGISNKDVILNLINIPKTIEVAVEVVGSLMEGVEAVTAASRLMEEAKKKVKDDAHKVALLENTTLLYKCINKYLSQYNLKQDDINNIVKKVEKQLCGLPPTIPASWKLLTVKVDKVTKNNLLAITNNVKKFLDESGANEILLTARSQKELDNLTKHLILTAEGIQIKYKGEDSCKIPTDTNVIIENVKVALMEEIAGLSHKSNVKKDSEQNESSVVKSAWRALSALKSQLELLKNKKSEYENILNALEADLAAS